ncbi:MAG: hypothetical protein QOC94_988 [Actinoplanes sp.]|nr:hypothetical protein [Actinoplanes sp.]
MGARRGCGPRSILTRSVCWQTALPTALGTVLATIAGIGLGAALLKASSKPVHIDWFAVAAVAGGSAAVIALALLLTLPVLWRLLRSDALRFE